MRKIRIIMISVFSESDQRQSHSLPIKAKQNVTQRAFFGKNGIELTALEEAVGFFEQRLSRNPAPFGASAELDLPQSVSAVYN